MKKIFAAILLVSVLASSYIYRENITSLFSSTEKGIARPEISVTNTEGKEVEVFDLSEEEITLELSKSGITSSSTIAFVTPQTSGRIEDIKVKVGDNVKKGDLLIKLGDSLSTDIADIQYQTAANSYEIALQSQELTQISSQESLYAAQLGVQTAFAAYQNSINARENTETLLDLQIDSAEDKLDDAEDAYEDAKDDYYDTLRLKDDLEDDYEALYRQDPTNSALTGLQAQIKELETALIGLKAAKDGTESAVEQLELALEQLEETRDGQLDQLDFAIEASSLQYESAIVQYKSLQTGSEMQELGSLSQLIQAGSALESAKLSSDQKNLKAPTSGVVTSITAEEGNLTSPGQVLIKIEDSNKISVQTSINQQEAGLVTVGDKAIIEIDSTEVEGEVISISPSLNAISKKIDVEIEIENSGNLTPGAFAKVKIIPSQSKKIFIPLNSVVLSEGLQLVKVIENNTVVCKQVEIGQIIGNYVEIKIGLKGNELIVKAQTSFIEDGDEVIIVK